MIARATPRTQQPIAFSAATTSGHALNMAPQRPSERGPAWAILNKPIGAPRPIALAPAILPNNHHSKTLTAAPAQPTTPRTNAQVPSTPTERRANPAQAKYFGQGTLSIRSSITGHHYRFEGHGDTLTIDSRDNLMLRRIPELQIV